MYDFLAALAGDEERLDVLKRPLLLTGRAKEASISSISLILTTRAAAIVRGIETCK